MLHSFDNNLGDPLGAQYSGIVAQGRDGNLYSTSFGGGHGSNAAGTVFQVTPSSGALTVPYTFDIFNFSHPFSGLTLGTDGLLYGASSVGGPGFPGNTGTIFNTDSSGNLITLHNFTGGSDGAQPFAPPIQGTVDGNFYGTTYEGGSAGFGVVYQLTPAGKFKTLHAFGTSGPDGAGPTAPLVQGSDGNFYGTTSYGNSGSTAEGTVFRITSKGKVTIIYKFDITHGTQPIAPVIQGSDGNFYGTTTGGGANKLGVVFKLTPKGKLLFWHSFDGTDGQAPTGGLVEANDGTFYGTASAGGTLGFGTVFKITSAGAFTPVCNFDKATGATPEVTLVQHTNGLFYGDTLAGGTRNLGVFYSVTDPSQQPFVSLLFISGKVGDLIGVLGQGFTGTTAVSFNGVPATFTLDPVTPDTYLTATVPSGATKGKVTVVSPTVNLTSNKVFTVVPVILSFSPKSGKVGDSVVITGSGLTQASKVTFGGVTATFSVNSDSQVTATVPTGAKTGKIAITTPGGTATSKKTFTVTP